MHVPTKSWIWGFLLLSFWCVFLPSRNVSVQQGTLKTELKLSYNHNRKEYILSVAAAAAAKSLQSHSTLCDPIDGSPPGSPVPGILQARTLEWVAISFSNAQKEKWKWSQSCPTLSNPMDCSLPGTSVHGIFQAKVLEWVAIDFSDILSYFTVIKKEMATHSSTLA